MSCACPVFPAKFILDHSLQMFTGTVHDRIWCGTSRRSSDCTPWLASMCCVSHAVAGCAGEGSLNKILKQPVSTCFCRVGDGIRGVRLQVRILNSPATPTLPLFPKLPPSNPSRSVRCMRSVVSRAMYKRIRCVRGQGHAKYIPQHPTAHHASALHHALFPRFSLMHSACVLQGKIKKKPATTAQAAAADMLICPSCAVLQGRLMQLRTKFSRGI